MLLFCCHTPAHEILYREIFLPSVPPGFEVRSTTLGIEGAGDYLSSEFLMCIRKKIDLVVRSIEENPGAAIVWSDVDIRFFDLSPQSLQAELANSGRDLLFQRESPRMPDVNTGFFVCRCTLAVRNFFQCIRTELESHPEENEQMTANRLLLHSDSEKAPFLAALPWSYLPLRFYARTHGWPPPRKLAIYHANYTKGSDGIGQKLIQFREIENIFRGGWLPWIWSVAKRIPKKLFATESGNKDPQ